MDVSITPAATDEEAAAIAAAIEVLWPSPDDIGRRRRPALAGVAVQRALVEPADPAAARPPVGLARRARSERLTAPWPSS